MTEHDGLTALQEAERRYPTKWNDDQNLWWWRRMAFVSGAEWATEREKARADAAEAEVGLLKADLSRIDKDHTCCSYTWGRSEDAYGGRTAPTRNQCNCECHEKNLSRPFVLERLNLARSYEKAERERAEAAEARVAELEVALLENAIYMLGPERWRGAIWVCQICAHSGPASGPAQFPSEAKIEHAADCLLFAAPTTEAVTEVEGS